MYSSKIGIGTAALAALAGGALLWSQNAQQPGGPGRAMAEKERAYKSPVFFAPSEVPRWPLTKETQAYASINGDHLLEYVKDLTEISHHSRDRGEQLWGRITGTKADAETAQYFMAKLKQAGVTDVRQQSLDLPEQRDVRSWEVSVTADGTSIRLESSVAARGAPGTNGATLDVEAVYVGLGSEADFAGRDVKRKAVFVYSVPLPGPWQQTITRFDAAKRAEDRGAAAMFNVIAIPGNLRSVVGASTRIPGFTLGSQDGARVRELIEQSASGHSPRVKIRSDVGTASGQKTSLVWGVIPGTTDEKIIINAHGQAQSRRNTRCIVVRRFVVAVANTSPKYPKKSAAAPLSLSETRATTTPRSEVSIWWRTRTSSSPKRPC
jgi:hypothetical protein